MRYYSSAYRMAKGVDVKAATTLALIATGLGLAAHAADGQTAAQPAFDDDWMEKLSAEDRERLARHKGGISSHPLMVYDVMDVRYDPVYDMPLATFHDELTVYGRDGYKNARNALLHILNIQLVSPRHRIDFPASATLVVALSKNGLNTTLPIEMRLAASDTYYIADPLTATTEFAEAVGAFDPHGRFPRMTLASFEGFEFNESTVEDMPPLGVAITYNVRFGSVRVDTGFQWAGRPPGIPVNGGTNFLK